MPGDVSAPSKYRGAQGLDPEFIKSLEKQFGFDKPAYERFGMLIVELSPLRFRPELFPRHQRAQADRREIAGVDLARAVDDAAVLRHLDSARHPQGGARRLALRRVDQRGDRRRLTPSRASSFAVFLIVLFAGGSFLQIFPLRGLVSENWSELPWYLKITDYFWHLTLPLYRHGACRPSPRRPSSPRTRSSRRSGSNM